MDYQKDYVQKLNFKEHEKTNVLAYELIMRNKDCQKNFNKLHRIIKKSNEIRFQANQTIDEYSKSEELRKYVNNRLEKDQAILKYSTVQSVFLKEILNYLLILKGVYEEEEHSGYFKNYIVKKQKELKNDKYIRYDKVIDSIENMIELFVEGVNKVCPDFDTSELNAEIKNILETLIQSIGYKILSRKYDHIVGLSTSDEKQVIIEKFQSYINETLAIIGVSSDLWIDKLSREIKYNIDEDMESYYEKYKKFVRNITRLEKLRHATENYISYEFYIDFQQELYLDYSFFSSKLQKDLHEFYQIVQQRRYSELEIPHHTGIEEKKIVNYDDFSLELRIFFSVDTDLMNQISSVYLAEDMLRLARQNSNEFVFRSTTVKPNYARPPLFSERFREVTFNFNPNLSKKELKIQFEAIVDLYKSDKLKNRSIYETLGEEFGKWSKKIKRPKRDYSTKQPKENKYSASKDILTILNSIPDLLYIYDSHSQGVSHAKKIYPTNMSEGSVSSYLNMAQFLIDEQGYKILLSSHK